MSTCEEKAGFLFSHRCTSPPGGQCQTCSKSVCTKHTHATPNGYMCTTCAKKHLKASGATRQRGRPDRWDDDPFLYDVYFYHGYGQFGHGRWGHGFFDEDFTEADGAGFGDEGGWDHEMGGS